MSKLAEIEGIGATLEAKLNDAGVTSVEDLLQKGATPSGRATLAASTGLTGNQILEWVNRADLARIKGVGSEYADLLEAAGVDTVPELAQRNSNSLHVKLVALNESKHLVRKVPSEAEVAKFIDEAKTLPRVVLY